MIKNLMINASKTAAAIVYYNELWAMGQRISVGDDNAIFSRSSPVQIGTLSSWVSGSTGHWAGNAINTSGSLWAWGIGVYGQLGLGDVTDRSSPVQVGTLNNWASVIMGYHTMAIKTDGTLWAWGYNSAGQLGLNDLTNRSSPVQVGTLTNWRSVVTGTATTAAIKTDGTLWTWGQNNFGTTGLARPNDNLTFSPIFGSSTFKEVSVGSVSYTMAINSDGSLWGWGNNNSYYLGDGTTTNRIVPTKNTANTATTWKKLSSNSHTMGIKTDGTLWGWGIGTTGRIGNDSTGGDISPQQIGTDTNWKDVAAGSANTVAIKTDGTLWTWGGNTSGQLGSLLATNTQRSSPVQVGALTDWSTCAANGSIVNSHCAAIKTDGTLWTWGVNSSGQLGIRLITSRSSPVQVGTLTTWKNVAVGDSHTMAIKTDGTLWGWGQNSSGQIGDDTTSGKSSPVQVGTLTNWRSVSAGNGQTIAIKTDGTAWAWGINTNGRLGLGDIANRSSPVQVGALTNWVSGSAVSSVSALLNTDGIVYTAGNTAAVTVNALGRYVSSTFDRSSPVQVGTLTNWSSISLKYDHCLAITTGGSLYSWGLNSSGQLGAQSVTGRSSPVQVGALTDWSTAQAGDTHSVGIKTDGTLWIWGNNDYGQLGLGVVTSRSSPVQMGTLATWNKSSAGFNGTMAIKTDGTLWGWGRNNVGQLGLNDQTNRSSPVQVGTSISWHSVSIDDSVSILIKRYL